MTQRPLLDTHIWLWWMTGDQRLRDTVRTVLDILGPRDRPYLSAISLWEVAMLVERRRIGFTVPLAEWLRDATAPSVVELVPITPGIAADTAAFPVPFHRDPADRLIVATSRILGAPLVTEDRAIIDSRLVRRWKLR